MNFPLFKGLATATPDELQNELTIARRELLISAAEAKSEQPGTEQEHRINPQLTPERVSRKAVVYIRPSKPSQLIHNQASTRLPFSLADRARTLGFQRILVIDDDLGRTGSGWVDRPGFERLAAEVGSGEVGAIVCVEASRLARNGREWPHRIDLSGRVGAVVVDRDGIYDPTLTKDRFLLGRKGTISEFEVNLFRQRSTEAILQKARRGELQIQIPVGFCWAPSGKLEKDPDQRVQQARELVFRNMTELGSIRQVLRWFREEHILLPAFPHGLGEPKMIWKFARIRLSALDAHPSDLCQRLLLRQN